MDEPTISLKLSEYDKLRQGTRLLEQECQRLGHELAEARLADPEGTLKAFHAAFHDTMAIVQFAVGNLAPETAAGWPHEALARVAAALAALPGVDRHLAEVAPELREFAKQAAGLEAWRRERDKNRVVTIATAADFGPQTDEARRIHEARTKIAPGPQVENV